MPRCYSDTDPDFTPAMRLISSITNANPAVVTTTFDHGYQDDLVVRFRIPIADGMPQINKLTAPITVTGTDTFTVPIDTTNFDAFAIPAPVLANAFVCAQIIPVGEANGTLNSAVRNVL